MISTESEKCFSRLLMNIATCERSTEITRQILAQNTDFDPYQAFRNIDTEDKANIDSINLVNFLKRNGIYSTTIDTQFIILFADENSDGLMSYSEFLNLVLSETNYSLRRSARERVGKANNKLSMPFNVEYSLVKLLEKELNLVRVTRVILDELRLMDDFNPHELYSLLKEYGFITLESLKCFFERQRLSYCEEDLKAIIKRLDFNNDSRIDYEEFYCFLSFPRCSKCCCYNHHCCCKKIMSSTVNKTLPNNVNQSSLSTASIKQSPIRDQLIYSNMNNESTKVSPFLSLRLSPQRHYSPKQRTSPIRESQRQEGNINQVHYSLLRTTSPSRNNGILRMNKPNTPHHSPLRTNDFKQYHSMNYSPHHQKLPFCQCHARPCFCCKISYEKAENLFINYFKDMLTIEYQIERAKIDLATRSDFTVEDCFRIFKMEGRGYITENDLHFSLSHLEIFASNADINLLMKRIDIKRKGIITYEDFFDLVTPFEKDYRAMVENRCSNFSSCHYYNKADVFLIGTKIYLQSLLRLIISSENQLENIRSSLNESRKQLKILFNEISMGNSVFKQMDLSFYLKKKGVSSTEQKTALAFIRLDRNRNGKIEYWELLEELTGL